MPSHRLRPRSSARRTWLAVGTVIALVTLAACSGNVDLDTEDPEPVPSTSATTEDAPHAISRAVEPSAAHVLVDGDEADVLAVGTSRTYLADARVAVLAPQDDRAAVLRAASIGQAVGAPVLLSGATTGTLDSELLRLGVVGVVTVGSVDLTEIDTTGLVVAPAPEDVAELADLLAADLTEVPLPDGEPSGDVAALLALGEGEIYAAAPADQDGDASEDGSSSPAAEPTAVGELPPLAPPEQISGSVLMTDGDPSQIAAVATAVAAGADVLRVRGDVRGNPAAIEALAELDPATVVGLGAGYGSLETFEWRTATAQTGVQLPGGSQLVFDAKRYVALYGSPVTASLGILGEQNTPKTVDRAARYAARYDDLTDDTVVPALEIIVTVAAGSAGDDGNYSQEWSSDTFVPLIEAAADAGQYVILDFQPGRSSFPEQIREYEDLLAYPNVGVALDPEWRLGPDQLPLQQIGSVGIDEVNETIAYIADFVREHDLPQKMIVLHQFQVRMIADREDLDTSRSEVALVIHADGQGGQGAKRATWRTLHEDAPDGIHWGWKNFIDEDSPMLTPEQTYAQVDPVPDLVSYQ